MILELKRLIGILENEESNIEFIREGDRTDNSSIAICDGDKRIEGKYVLEEEIEKEKIANQAEEGEPT